MKYGTFLSVHSEIARVMQKSGNSMEYTCFVKVRTCLPECYQAHYRSSHSFSKKRIYNWMKSGCLIEIHISQAPFQVHRSQAECKLRHSQCCLTVPWLDLLELQPCKNIHTC